MAIKAASIALGKKASRPVVLALFPLTVITDYFVICSGESTTQVRAIADAVQEAFGREGIKPLGVEGLDYCHWVLLDFGDVIVHVFEQETREFYSLERLWMDAETIEVTDHEDSARLGRQDKRAVHS